MPLKNKGKTKRKSFPWVMHYRNQAKLFQVLSFFANFFRALKVFLTLSIDVKADLFFHYWKISSNLAVINEISQKNTDTDDFLFFFKGTSNKSLMLWKMVCNYSECWRPTNQEQAKTTQAGENLILYNTVFFGPFLLSWLCIGFVWLYFYISYILCGIDLIVSSLES